MNPPRLDWGSRCVDKCVWNPLESQLGTRWVFPSRGQAVCPICSDEGDTHTSPWSIGDEHHRRRARTRNAPCCRLHPDPGGQQMEVLRLALEGLMDGSLRLNLGTNKSWFRAGGPVLSWMWRAVLSDAFRFGLMRGFIWELKKSTSI